MTSAPAPDTFEGALVDELQPGTLLMHGQYKIRQYLNSGGFGITYLATDSNGRLLVIKECFPGSFCRRSKLLVQARSHAFHDELRAIVLLFTREAQALERLNHPNIVGVHQVFEDNNTAYMALDFVEGRDLLTLIKTREIEFDPETIRALLTKLLGAIGYVHDAGLLHRDISPDNVIVTRDLEPVLIDFGAAREQATKATRALSALRVVKDGYSPQEFYIAGSEQSPSSDLYSLAATFYHLITGEIPPDSQIRLSAHVNGEKDPYVALAEKTDAFDPVFCAALDKAMAILPKDRVQSAREWLGLMSGKARITNISRPKSRMRRTNSPGQPEAATRGSRAPALIATTAALVAAGGGMFLYLDPLAGQTTASVARVWAESPEVKALASDEPSSPMVDMASKLAGGTAQDAASEDTVSASADAGRTETILQQVAQAGSVGDTAADDTRLPEPLGFFRDGTPVSIEAPGPAPSQAAALTGGADPSADKRQGFVDASGLTSGWTVDLPFTTRGDAQLIVGDVDGKAPAGVVAGMRIVRVEGQPVTSLGEVMNAARHARADIDALSAKVSIAFEDPADGTVLEQDIVMPIVFESTLPNGLKLHTRRIDGAWRTTVAAVPAAPGSTVREGDVLVAFLPSRTPIEDSDTLRSLLIRTLEEGAGALRVAVRRDGSMWVETMTLGATAG